LCKSKTELQQARQAQTAYSTAAAGGFGFSDFAEALSYPFKFKTSLFFGAAMFMFFTLGQSAAALGGIFMVVAAIFCFMLANMLTFGVLANTVDNFAQGKIGGNFMPSFDDFSIWDDVLHPFFLWLGAMLSSFGPCILVVAIGMYFVISSMTSQSQAMQSEIEKIPGTNYYDAQRTMQQSQQVKGLLGNTAEQNEQRLKLQEQLEQGTAPAATNPQDTEVAVQQANELIQKTQKAQLESTIGKSPETRQKETEQMVKNFLSLAAPLVVLAAIFFLWGAFYFPAACAVAGYTRSFAATINPLVGLDTIKRLGVDYVKILLMGLVIVIVSAIVGGLLGMILAPFDLPGFANLPAKAIGSLFGFYFSVVFSCILGFALFKASDRLKLYK
jgi:VIT1/CCC1 family predicted Fe2+/Mn2+ transporter